MYAMDTSSTAAVIATGVAVVAFVLGGIVRPLAGRASRVAQAAAKLALVNAEAAAQLIVDAATASNKLASDSAAAAANINLETALRNQKIDTRLETLLRSQESHERRLTSLEGKANKTGGV
jgi:hypothetical protein